ncbi:uncharacterized protein [Macaca fascicularis]|uniref:uncharacterized protein n=1 Tax=Macaca fascicularis TaxID=9541 RepID=UPI003D157ECC
MALGPFLQAEGGRELWVKPEGGMPEAPRTPRSPRGQPSYRRRRRRRTTTQTHTDRPPPPRRAVCAGALTAPQAPPPSPAPPGPLQWSAQAHLPTGPELYPLSGWLLGCCLPGASFLPLLVLSSPGSKASLAGAVSIPTFRRKLPSWQIFRISASRALLTGPTLVTVFFSASQLLRALLGPIKIQTLPPRFEATLPDPAPQPLD